MNDPKNPRRWAEFRFSVIGPLLSCPPKDGDLRVAIQKLSEKEWMHPIKKELYKISFSTIERWYYTAKKERSPIDSLTRKTRSDWGQKVIGDDLRAALQEQYDGHPTWTYRLHFDNLKVLFPANCPSYSTVRRYMKSVGLVSQKRSKTRRKTLVSMNAHFQKKEVRSFENPYNHGLWHLDCAP